MGSSATGYVPRNKSPTPFSGWFIVKDGRGQDQDERGKFTLPDGARLCWPRQLIHESSTRAYSRGTQPTSPPASSICSHSPRTKSKRASTPRLSGVCERAG